MYLIQYENVTGHRCVYLCTYTLVWCCVSEADSHEKLMRGRLRCVSVLHHHFSLAPLALFAQRGV